MGDRDALADRLTTTRDRTHELYRPIGDADVVRTPTPIMSPPVWDLGHIAAYEELWVACTLAGQPSCHPDLQQVYDAFETPRAVRTEVPLLDRAACERYLAEVHERSLAVLAEVDLVDGPHLAANGFVFDMVAQHEAQHTETVLQTLQLFEGGEYRPQRAAPAPMPVAPAPRRIEVAGGAVPIGADGAQFAYDCERPRHRCFVRPFAIDRLPVTNAQYAAFVQDGGYRREDLWSDEGWIWRVANDVTAPLFWQPDGADGWLTRSFDLIEPLQPDHPVCHVSFWEAEAFATWVGARLPSEAEWELAARGADARHAHLDQLGFGTAPVGAHPLGASDIGCLDMLGNVWEWTATRFGPYPGFTVDPYPQYAEVFFGGDYRVLRGGSWATQPIVTRTTFRNWDHPHRRQIFAGLRLAWDLT